MIEMTAEIASKHFSDDSDIESSPRFVLVVEAKKSEACLPLTCVADATYLPFVINVISLSYWELNIYV